MGRSGDSPREGFSRRDSPVGVPCSVVEGHSREGPHGAERSAPWWLVIGLWGTRLSEVRY